MSIAAIPSQVVAAQPYSIFHVEVARTRRLSPSFLRVTFTGEHLAHFADLGHDQRIKVVLPLPGVDIAEFPDGPDWYQRWRALPDERRHPLRTYTEKRRRSLPSQCLSDEGILFHSIRCRTRTYNENPGSVFQFMPHDQCFVEARIQIDLGSIATQGNFVVCTLPGPVHIFDHAGIVHFQDIWRIRIRAVTACDNVLAPFGDLSCWYSHTCILGKVRWKRLTGLLNAHEHLLRSNQFPFFSLAPA